MATTNIELDIENITGVADADDQFIKTAQKFVVSSIPKNLMLWAGTSTAPATHGGDDSPEAVTLPQPTDNIIDVVRNGFSAEQVPESMQGFIKNSNSLHKATATYPKYFIQAGNKVIVNPVPTSGETVLVNYVDFLKVDDDCDLRGAVVFHAASKEFEKLASGKVTDWTDLVLPVPPASPSFTYTDASVSDIVQPLISISDMASMTESAPSYIAPPEPSLTSVTFTSVDSALDTVAPIFTTATVSASSVYTGSAPSYTSPVLSLTTFPTITWTFPSVPVSPTTSAQTVATFGNVPTFTPPVMGALDFADTEDLITSEEDSEMLAARVQEIQAKIGEFSARLGETQSKFNKENSIFQADVQEKIQEAQLADAQEARKLQSFQNDISNYQSEVNKVIQGNQSEISEWQIRSTTDIQKYGSDIQNTVNTFNKENVAYQSAIQESMQEIQVANQINMAQAQSDLQVATSNKDRDLQRQLQNGTNDMQAIINDNGNKISIHNNNIQNALNSFNKENILYQQDIQRKTQNLQKDIQEAVQNAQNDIAINSANLQKDVQIGLQNALQDFQQDVGEYAAKIQKYGADLQNYQAEVGEKTAKIGSATQNAAYYSQSSDKYYKMAQQEVAIYVQNNSKMINRTMAAQAAAQQQRR